MRCLHSLHRLHHNLAFVTNKGWQLIPARAYGDSAATSGVGPSSSGRAGDEPVFAACVLQRLPLVRQQTPPSHVQHLLTSRARALDAGELKDYPEASVAGRDDGAATKQQQQDLRTFTPVPSTTAADMAGDVRTMRRQLHESLYLVVRTETAPPGADAAAGAGTGIASDSSGRGGVGGWAFPSAANTAEESISDTAQRALFSSIGRSHPVFFVGRAPMAHLPGHPKGKTFFMLAQAVDDPWDVRVPGGGEHAWLTKSELATGSYLSDPRLRELVSKML